MPEPILMFEPLLEPIQSRLEAQYQVYKVGDPAVDARAGDIRVVVSGGATGMGSEWFDRLPNLGLIALNGVGTDKVDLDRAASRRIHVTTTPGVLTADVADLGMALILSSLRLMGQGERLVRGGGWSAGASLPLARSLAGKRLGIVGLGAIGEAIGRRAGAFSMEVGFWSRSHKEVEGWTRQDSVLALADWADVLAVAVAATPETLGLVDAAVLRALGPDGFIVNVARGSVIDEPALLDALERRTIAGAGLDVFLNEPRIDPRFLALENVFLMPHQGSATVETRTAMAQTVADNVAAFLAGEEPPTSVTAARFAE